MHNAASSDLGDTGPWDGLLRPASARPLHSPHLAGQRVLITGAAGSIGSALTHAVAASSPASLILLDTSENGLYHLDRSLHAANVHHHVPLLGSVTNQTTLDHLFHHHHPQIIFHAAALKHVPLMEQNPFAALDNNSLGTLTLAHAALAHRSQHLVIISTDKAVDPHSIMGASKRIAELIFLSLATAATRMTAVRLCNVIGSQGSVLPLFREQLAHNLPLTVTDPESHRYFIPLDRAIEALLSALHSTSTSALLLPEVATPIRILDLATHLLGTHPTTSSSIEFTGLRPGDKLTEHLLSPREQVVSSTNETLRTIQTPIPTLATLHAALTTLREAIHSHDLPQLLRAIHTLVPEYQPSAAIKNSLTQYLAPELQA